MKRALPPLLPIVLTTLAGSALAQPAWRVYPPAPTAGEAFVIQYDSVTPGGPTTVRNATISVEGSTLKYEVDINENDFSVVYPFRASATVPGVAAGDYQVIVTQTGGSAGPVTATLGTVHVSGAPTAATPAYRGLSGNWFDPDASGWGMNVVQGDSGALFAVWLTYRPIPQSESYAATNNMWLVMPAGRWISPTQFRGLLYATSGTTVAAPFRAADLAVTPAGYVSFDFSSPSQVAIRAEAAVGDPSYAPIIKEATIRRFQF